MEGYRRLRSKREAILHRVHWRGQDLSLAREVADQSVLVANKGMNEEHQ
jgi:hypothetical protein